MEGAYIIKTHPTANEVSLFTGKLIASLQGAEQKDYYSDSWYNETYMEPNKTTERFPYMLANTFPKWGSGLQYYYLFRERRKRNINNFTGEAALFSNEAIPV